MKNVIYFLTTVLVPRFHVMPIPHYLATRIKQTVAFLLLLAMMWFFSGCTTSYYSQKYAREEKYAQEQRYAKEQQEYAQKLQEVQSRFVEFKERARAWRALPVKPELPEETKKQKTLAENAVREKRFLDAMGHYKAGLQACSGLWPEGNFNMAILGSGVLADNVASAPDRYKDEASAGQATSYLFVVDYMKCYLELVPDAPDAKAAKEKIIIWEDKINKALTALTAGKKK